MRIDKNRVIRGGRNSNSYKVTTENVSIEDVLFVTIKKDDDNKFCLVYQIEGKDVADKNSVHFYPTENGVRWSGCTAKLINRKGIKENNVEIEKESIDNTNSKSKLEPIGKLILELLHEKDSSICQYEYSPEWLVCSPSINEIEKHPIIKKVYSKLTENKVNYMVDNNANNKKQKFDIWVGEPYNFAVEFDEKQHLNSFRNQTFEFYKDFTVGFSVQSYKSLCNKVIKPGESGFTKLKSVDNLFPPMYQGSKQDNRVRQRAFRDFLKDYLPIINDCKPTIRIPYTLIGKINNFTSDDLTKIRTYLEGYLCDKKRE